MRAWMELKSGHIMRALGPIWLEKPETARRVLQRIGSVLLWAKGRGFRTDNPTDEVAAARKALPKQKDKPKHHTALPYADVPTFITKLRDYKGATEQIKLALEFLILTATRTSEVLRAQWNEVNLDKGLWTIPASRMKAGREHVVPLSARCIEILEEARKLSDGKSYIFPRHGDGQAAHQYGVPNDAPSHGEGHHRARVPLVLPGLGGGEVVLIPAR